MAADGMGGRDAASLLASLATLQHTPRSVPAGMLCCPLALTCQAGMHILRIQSPQEHLYADPMLKITLPLCVTLQPLLTGAPCSWFCALGDCCSEQWLHACLNLLHWKLRELDPEGLATVATSLVKQGVFISNGEALLGG